MHHAGFIYNNLHDARNHENQRLSRNLTLENNAQMMLGEYNVDVHPSVYMIFTLKFITFVSSLLLHLMARSFDNFKD